MLVKQPGISKEYLSKVPIIFCETKDFSTGLNVLEKVSYHVVK